MKKKTEFIKTKFFFPNTSNACRSTTISTIFIKRKEKIKNIYQNRIQQTTIKKLKKAITKNHRQVNKPTKTLMYNKHTISFLIIFRI